MGTFRDRVESIRRSLWRFGRLGFCRLLGKSGGNNIMSIAFQDQGCVPCRWCQLVGMQGRSPQCYTPQFKQSYALLAARSVDDFIDERCSQIGAMADTLNLTGMRNPQADAQ